MKNAVRRSKVILIFFPIIFFSFFVRAYSQSNSDSSESLTLSQCIDYALKHQPLLQQSLIGVDIARTTNKINLAGWLPQANLSANFTHYLQLPSVISDSTGGKVIRTGITNTFVPAFTVSQAIFSPTLFYASKSAPLYVKQAGANY